jgi:hypothetical protein
MASRDRADGVAFGCADHDAQYLELRRCSRQLSGRLANLRQSNRYDSCDVESQQAIQSSRRSERRALSFRWWGLHGSTMRIGVHVLDFPEATDQSRGTFSGWSVEVKYVHIRHWTVEQLSFVPITFGISW